MIHLWVSQGLFWTYPALNFDMAYGAFKISGFYDDQGDVVCRLPDIHLN